MSTSKLNPSGYVFPEEDRGPRVHRLTSYLDDCEVTDEERKLLETNPDALPDLGQIVEDNTWAFLGRTAEDTTWAFLGRTADSAIEDWREGRDDQAVHAGPAADDRASRTSPHHVTADKAPLCSLAEQPYDTFRIDDLEVFAQELGVDAAILETLCQHNGGAIISHKGVLVVVKPVP